MAVIITKKWWERREESEQTRSVLELSRDLVLIRNSDSCRLSCDCILGITRLNWSHNTAGITHNSICIFIGLNSSHRKNPSKASSWGSRPTPRDGHGVGVGSWHYSDVTRGSRALGADLVSRDGGYVCPPDLWNPRNQPSNPTLKEKKRFGKALIIGCKSMCLDRWRSKTLQSKSIENEISSSEKPPQGKRNNHHKMTALFIFNARP